MSLERLKLDVALKLAVVENSLSRVEEYRHQLQENAQKVVTAHQTCLLGTQQAGLTHSKGALTATRDLLQCCHPSDTSTLAKIKVMDDVECLRNVQPVKNVSVQLDESALSSAVSEFGSVQLPDTITHHPSPVIPANVEEYEDDDHDVLHKSVAGAASGPDSPMRITVQFPRLSKHNWLVQQKEKHLDQSLALKACGIGEETKLNDVASWWSGVNQNDVATWWNGVDLTRAFRDGESTPASMESFDMVARNSPVHTSESSSIEIVPSHYDSEKDDCSTPGSGMCEIENVHLCVGEKSRWLSDRHSCCGNPFLEQIEIGSICQANETCSTFSDCVCQNNCKETALEKLQQSASFRAKTSRKRTLSESESIGPILSHMADIIASENSQWLLQSQDNVSVLPTPVKRAMYEAPGGKWLRLGQSMSVTHEPQVKLCTHSNIWLLSKFKSQREKNTEKDENDKEKFSDEKESRITSEALSEALKRVTISPHNGNQNKSCNLGNYHAVAVDRANTPVDSQSWLLSKKLGGCQQVRDNKLEEMDISNKRRWLFCSSEGSSIMKCGNITPPLLPESLLSMAHADVNNWLMKSYY
ncbi:uncharacterized protein [Panulirus ornatus]|uniref:uncharacterized protein isoform X2 n=1 Tax=Panulirus ornatus TaxID=150431 RepID=UPI003A896362